MNLWLQSGTCTCFRYPTRPVYQLTDLVKHTNFIYLLTYSKSKERLRKLCKELFSYYPAHGEESLH